MEKKFHEEISKLTLAQPKPNNLNLYKQLSTTNKTRNNSNLVSNNSNTTTLKTNKMATTITTNFSRNKQINLEEIKKDTFFNNKDNNLSYFTDFKKHSSETENTIIKKNTDQAKPSVSILSPNLIFSGRLNYLDENEVNSKINDKELAQRNVNENSKIIFSNENHKNNIMNNTVYLNKTTKDRIKKLNVTDKSLNRIEDLLFNKSKDEKFKSRSNSNNSFHLTNKKKSIKSTLLNQINSLLTMIEKSPKERIYDKINVIKTQVKNIEDKSYVDKAEIDGNNDSDNSLKYIIIL